MPPPSTLRDLVQAASLIVDTLFEPNGQMKAYFLARRPDGEQTLVVTVFVDVASELAFRVGGPVLLRKAGFTHWCFFTEAWLAAGTARELGGRLPSEQPHRIEVITFAAGDVAGEKIAASRQIVRGNGPARLLPLVFSTERAVFVTAPIGAAAEQQRSEQP